MIINIIFPQLNSKSIDNFAFVVLSLLAGTPWSYIWSLYLEHIEFIITETITFLTQDWSSLHGKLQTDNLETYFSLKTQKNFWSLPPTIKSCALACFKGENFPADSWIHIRTLSFAKPMKNAWFIKTGILIQFYNFQITLWSAVLYSIIP